MRDDYTPRDWHWIVADDETRLWSSAAGAYVEELPDDAGVTRIASERELSEVLAVYGLPGPFVSNDPRDYPLERWEFKAMVGVLGVATAIEDAIALAFSEDLARQKALARYRESNRYRRDDPLFDTLAPLVGLTDEQIDVAWMQIARPAG